MSRSEPDAKAARPARREPIAPPTSPRAAKEVRGPWLVAGRGLQTYSIGLVLRLVLGILFFIGLLLVAGNGSSATKGIGLLFALMSVTTGFVMLSGLGRFSRQPADSPGRSSARFAATVLAITVAVELLCLLLSAGVAISGESDSHITDRFSVHVATLWRWAAALWLAHVGATIVAMWKIAPLFDKKPPTSGRYVLPILVLVAGAAVFVTWNTLPTLGLGVTGSLLLVCLTALFLLSAMAIYVAAIDHHSKNLRTAGNIAVPKSTVRAG